MNEQPTEAKVKRYMRRQAKWFIDPTTGEYNTTGIAEDAIDYFNLEYEDAGQGAPVWDWAFEVVEALGHYRDLTGKGYNHET